MRETLIANHNSVVKKDDFIYHLGDMFWNSLTDQECFDILARLNGRHYYILGNHEKAMNRNKALRESFGWVRDVENLQFSGYPNIFLCHYAMRVWNGSHKGAYHLYGHSHAALKEIDAGKTLEESPLSFDVGVDAQNFLPISLEQVHKKMQIKEAVWKKNVYKCACGNKFIKLDKDTTTCSKCGQKMEKE